MRISDWSSDVCSSDLYHRPGRARGNPRESTGSDGLSGRRIVTCLIQTRALHTHYGQSHILHGVDLEIRPGEAVGLLGRNGMGKTTLIRSIMGHVRPSSGRIAVRGHDCGKAPPHRISRLGIAYVPEGRGIGRTHV